MRSEIERRRGACDFYYALAWMQHWCRWRSTRSRDEIFGPESSGKTTLALHIVAEAQKLNGVALYRRRACNGFELRPEKLGVDIDQLLISQPDSGEQALEIAEALVRSNGIDVIVVDSVAALVPRAELDGEMGDSPSRLAGALDVAGKLRKLTAIVAQSIPAFIFINQIREKIGVMFGSPETTTEAVR